MKGNLHLGPHEPHDWPNQIGHKRHKNQHKSSEDNFSYGSTFGATSLQTNENNSTVKSNKKQNKTKKFLLSNEKATIQFIFLQFFLWM